MLSAWDLTTAKRTPRSLNSTARSDERQRDLLLPIRLDRAGRRSKFLHDDVETVVPTMGFMVSQPRSTVARCSQSTYSNVV